MLFKSLPWGGYLGLSQYFSVISNVVENTFAYTSLCLGHIFRRSVSTGGTVRSNGRPFTFNRCCLVAIYMFHTLTVLLTFPNIFDV